MKIVDNENEPQVESPEELESLADMRIKCCNNLAAAQLKVYLYINLLLLLINIIYGFQFTNALDSKLRSVRFLCGHQIVPQVIGRSLSAVLLSRHLSYCQK